MTAADPAPPDDQSRRLQRLGDAMAAYLAARAAGGDEAIAREQCLAAHPDLRDLLQPLFEDPGADGAADDEQPSAPTLEPGRTLADYCIVREIGRGGMGTVYEAEQLSLHRRVALKVLHGHLAWSPRSIERFRREAAAASRLRHPGLVPIHDVGEWRGLHWFSMEFVVGTPLNERMQERRLGVRADVGREAEAAELVARVAEALQAAHAQGLVHRDVKPHNVMVCPDGSVRLLDFGLVAGTEGQKDHSITGAFLGTPHYCSPEQVAGERVGPPADVFALGILLYELLAAERPFAAENTNAVLRRITGGQFKPLRHVAPGVPRDLQTICHKALEPQPADRYVDAGALAADLRRFLRIEPIHAVPPGAWTRSIKWLRRHRLAGALTASTVALLVLAAIAWQQHLHDSQQVSRTEGQFDQADEIAFRSIEQTLTLLSDQIDRQPSPGAKHEPRADELAALCEGFLAVRSDDPGRRARTAKAFWQLAGIYLSLGRTEPALTACARSRAILRAEAPRPDTAANVERQLGRICYREMMARQVADPSAGEAEFRAADGHWRPLSTLPDAKPEDVTEHVTVLLARARNRADLPDQRDEAERLLRDGAAMLDREALRQCVPARSLAVRLDGILAQVLLDRGRTKEALPLFDAVLARTANAEEPSIVVERALAHSGRGQALIRLRRATEAEQALRAAVETTEEALQDWPGSVALRRRLLESRVLLGSQLMVRGRLEDAEDLLRTAAAAIGPLPADPTKLHWAERSHRADLGVQLANCLLMHEAPAAADVANARELLQQSIALFGTLIAEQPLQLDFRVDLGVAYQSLASLCNEHGEPAAAAQHARQAIALQSAVLEKLPGNDRVRKLLGMHHAQLAWALVNTGKPVEAVDAARVVPERAPRELAALRQAAQVATSAAPGISDPEQAESARSLAVSILEHILTLDAKEGRRLIRDARFASLSDREDFRRLQQRVNAR